MCRGGGAGIHTNLIMDAKLWSLNYYTVSSVGMQRSSCKILSKVANFAIQCHIFGHFAEEREIRGEISITNKKASEKLQQHSSLHIANNYQKFSMHYLFLIVIC